MKRVRIGSAMALVLGRAVWSDDPPKKAEPPAVPQEQKDDTNSQIDKVKAAKQAFTEAQKNFATAYAEATKQGGGADTAKHTELAEAEKDYRKTRDAMIAAGLTAAKEEPNSPDAMSALETAVVFGLGSQDFLDRSIPGVVQ